MLQVRACSGECNGSISGVSIPTDYICVLRVAVGYLLVGHIKLATGRRVASVILHYLILITNALQHLLGYCNALKTN